MTHIEQMIQDMCPNGVEFKTLGEVCEIHDAKRKPVTKSQRASGEYPYYGANGIQDYVNDYIFDGTFLLIGEDGSVINKDKSPVINWAKGKIWVNNHAHILSEKKDIVLLRFLYYYLQTIDVSDLVWGTPPKLNQQNLRSIEIPLPPLEIQKKIVECLDKFSALAAELQAELQMRRKQYEYYRTQLLTPHSDCNSADNTDDRNWKWKTLGEICEINRGVRVVRSELEQEGKYPVYQNSLTPLGYYDKCNYPANTTFIISAGAAGKVGYSDVDFWAADDCLCIKCPEALNAKFLFYYMLDKQDFFLSQVRHASVPRMSRTIVENFKLPIPSLAEQARIVAILDKFEKLITSMEEGIPAEQIRQQKRYEHFRDLLLTFDRKAV